MPAFSILVEAGRGAYVHWAVSKLARVSWTDSIVLSGDRDQERRVFRTLTDILERRITKNCLDHNRIARVAALVEQTTTNTHQRIFVHP